MAHVTGIIFLGAKKCLAFYEPLAAAVHFIRWQYSVAVPAFFLRIFDHCSPLVASVIALLMCIRSTAHWTIFARPDVRHPIRSRSARLHPSAKTSLQQLQGMGVADPSTYPQGLYGHNAGLRFDIRNQWIAVNPKTRHSFYMPPTGLAKTTPACQNRCNSCKGQALPIPEWELVVKIRCCNGAVNGLSIP